MPHPTPVSRSAGALERARSLFDGDGEMRGRLRAFKWENTPLGPVENWPQSLRLTVRLCLNNRFPMCLWWGPELTIIYNEAYMSVFGQRHPEAIGRSARDMWAETWSAVEAQVNDVMEQGQSSWHERRLIRTERNGQMADAWFTWSFSPLYDDHEAVAGVCLTTLEETADVLREKELIQTRDRLTMTLNAAEIGSWSLDGATGQVIADANLARAFSISPELAASGTTLDVFTDAIHRDDRARIVAAITEAAAHQSNFEEEYRLAPQDGLVRTVLARGIVTRSVAGQMTSMSGVLIDITERKRSEALASAHNEILSLMISETSLSKILEALVEKVEKSGEAGAIACILLVDEDGRFRLGASPSLPDDFNNRLEGLSIGENVGTCGRAASLRQTVITTDISADPNWAPFARQAAEIGLIAAWTEPIISASGKVLGTFGTYFREKRGPTEHEKQTVDFLSKTAALAIERAQAVAILGESEERFRNLADNISQLAWMAEGNGSIFWYNRRWFDYTGTTLEQMKGWGWKQIHHPDHVTAVTAKFVRHVADGSEWEDTFPLRSASGEYRWFLSRAFPIRDARGEVVRWFGTNTDISSLRSVQDELRLSDQRSRQIADLMPQIVWGAGPDGVLDYYNKRWFEYIAVSPDDAARVAWAQYIHPEDLPQTALTWQAAVETGKNYQVEFRVRGADQNYRWFLTRAHPIRDESGTVVRWLGTCTDIHDRRISSEENLRIIERERAARLASENAGRMKDDFLATLSHELRTPLNPVLLLASESAEDQSLPPAVRANFEIIAKNVALEARLIDDLLDLTRITRGKMALTLEPVELHVVVRDALANVAAEISEKRIHLVTDFSDEPAIVMGDAVRLQQIFWNVFRNAAKFTPEAGSIRVESRLSADLQRIEVRVIDSGMGMSNDEVARLFNAFVQGDHAGTAGSHRFGGLGLGLAISRMLVELHSGRISGASGGEGLGSTFTIQLPLSRTLRSSNSNPAAPKRAANGIFRASRILLVEDHEPTRTSLEQLLLRRHYDVNAAASVEEAVAIAKTQRFDLLVTDIGLPDGDGYELMRVLHRDYGLKGIALTGFGMEEDIERSRLAGFAAHLTKPIRVQALDAALATAATVAANR